MIERIKAVHKVISRNVILAGRWTIIEDEVGPGWLHYCLAEVAKPGAKCCGRDSWYGDPANPTLFANGIGMVFLDDASAIHCLASLSPNPMLSDIHNFPTTGSRKVVLAVTEADDYREFVLALRGLYPSTTLRSPIAWLRLNHGMNDAQLVQWAKFMKPGCLILATGQHGGDLTGQPLAEEIARRKSLLPGVVQLVYHDFGWYGNAAEARIFPESVLAGGASLGAYTMMLPKSGGIYAAYVAGRVAQLVDSSGADGVYFDIAECPGPRYTYQDSDGVSGDPGRAKASVTLLTEYFRDKLLRNYGVVANMAPWTEASRDANVPRFIEGPSPRLLPSADIHSQCIYIGTSIKTEDAADALCQVISDAGYVPVEPWDIDFPRTRDSFSSLHYPTTVTQ